jgi:hypothetical protein
MDERWFGRFKYNTSVGITWTSRTSGTTNNLWFVIHKEKHHVTTTSFTE